MMDYMAEPLACSIRSVAPHGVRRLATAVATVWDANERFRPDRAGFSERTKKLGRGETLVDRLEAAWADGREVDDLWLYFEQPTLSLSGDVRVFDELAPTRDHTSGFAVALDRLEEGDLADLLDLAADLFVALDGYYGSIDTGPIRRQRTGLQGRAYEAETVAFSPMSDPTFWTHEHVLDGPWWANLYGPAFVARWDDALIDSLGVDRRRLANGGLLVVTADTPAERDDSVDSLIGYPHQQLLVGQLGADMFEHEQPAATLAPSGLHVPARAEHVAAAVHR